MLGFLLRLLGRCAAAFGEQVDGEGMRALLLRSSGDAELNEEQQQADIDRQRQREAGRSSPKRRPVEGRGEAVCGQDWGSVVASARGLAGFPLNRE